jgi:hypothetical protein
MPEKVSGSLDSHKRGHELIILALKRYYNDGNLVPQQPVVDVWPLLNGKIFNIRLISD